MLKTCLVSKFSSTCMDTEVSYFFSIKYASFAILNRITEFGRSLIHSDFASIRHLPLLAKGAEDDGAQRAVVAERGDAYDCAEARR